MAELKGTERARYVRDMFSRIAPRYDLMNRLMTAGQDGRWRRTVIARAGLSASGSLLDLGAGTGDLAFEALRQTPQAQVTAADFTLPMLQVGQRRLKAPPGGNLAWSAADALHLPFSSLAFDAVVSGFLLRNVTDLGQALSEQLRVLKPGGRMVALDTTRPGKNLFSPLVYLHLRLVIPLIGRLLTGQADAYRYLPSSTEGFLTAEELRDQMTAAGFQDVGFRRYMFGTIAIHWGKKP